MCLMYVPAFMASVHLYMKACTIKNDYENVFKLKMKTERLTFSFIFLQQRRCVLVLKYFMWTVQCTLHSEDQTFNNNIIVMYINA